MHVKTEYLKKEPQTKYYISFKPDMVFRIENLKLMYNKYKINTSKKYK